MQLKDEHLFSEINDPALVSEMVVVYGNSPVWYGGYFPKSSASELSLYCGHAADPYCIYRDFIEQDVERDGRVLDIGSAGGAQTSLLARYFSEVVAVEKAEEKMAFARKHNAHSNVTYVLDYFPCKEDIGKFDYIFCVSVLYQNGELHDKIVRDAHSRLKPGGKLFIYNPDTSDVDIDKWGFRCERKTGEFSTCPQGRMVIYAT